MDPFFHLHCHRWLRYLHFDSAVMLLRRSYELRQGHMLYRCMARGLVMDGTGPPNFCIQKDDKDEHLQLP